MKIVVAGKGGVGRTTVSGTVARALARAGQPVLALDADTNPTYVGGVRRRGPEQTDLLVAVRQRLETGETEHEQSTEGFVERFGTDAPDGVRLVVASRIDRPSPGCQCCGVSAEQLLGELDEGRVVVGDLEAGVGTVVRLQPGQADVIVVAAQPTAKSIVVARRALELAVDRAPRVVLVANRVRDDGDLEVILDGVGGDPEVVVVCDEPAIATAARDGRAAIDVDPDAPGVRALVGLADRLTGIGAVA